MSGISELTRLARRNTHASLALLIATTCCAKFGMAAEPRLIGNQSCATSTCHGGKVDSGPAWHHSFSTWMVHDPHAGAGLLLRDSDSRQIVMRLDPRAADSGDAYDNVLRTRCISCHVTVPASETLPAGPLQDSVLASGVSCESCHGPAELWVTQHIRSDWQGDIRFASETGMRDTESIIGRAETCVRCHVGSRTADGMVRDMNHDLIAAGHPALRFDLLLYSENMPKHWDTSSTEAATFEQSAIRVRDAGRAIQLAASLQLSAERAVDHLKDQQQAAGDLVSGAVPWPELADYDCFACHQALSFTPAKVEVVSSGVPIWNAWYTLRQLPISDGAMASLSPRSSDPSLIARGIPPKAQDWRGKATEIVQRQVDPSARIVEIAKELLDADSATESNFKPQKLTWQEAAIQYLRLDAAVRDLAKDPNRAAAAAQIRARLAEVEQSLRFDPDRASKRRAAYHSPIRFDPTVFRNAVRAALQPLSSSARAADPFKIPLSRSVASQP